jgi:hypothetical protein
MKNCTSEPAAFRQLVERYQSLLIRSLYARLGNAEEATEAAQETFVRAYFALPQLRKPASFSSWLLGIARRVIEPSALIGIPPSINRPNVRIWDGDGSAVAEQAAFPTENGA